MKFVYIEFFQEPPNSIYRGCIKKNKKKYVFVFSRNEMLKPKKEW